VAAVHLRSLHEILTVTSDTDRKRTLDLLEAIKRARRFLYGSGTPKQRVGAATAGFSAYRDGLLGAHVRDVCKETSIKSVAGALDILENLAQGYAEPEA
jgi:hypothetical protein